MTYDYTKPWSDYIKDLLNRFIIIDT